jgi:mannose-6-phosphate isomerase-like protein (cupin superfamily)
MGKITLIGLIIGTLNSYGQSLSVDTIPLKNDFENIYNRKLFSDSLASSFIILIKKEVKEHKHASHTEHIYVLDGEAVMTLGETNFIIKKGDVVFIPMNTFHSVKTTSSIPLKVLSVQSPFFDGSDRILK